MKIAILSGKGGAGKTLLAVNLSVLIPYSLYLDCDVEAPNGHLFLNPKVSNQIEVKIPVPQIDDAKCNGCRKCINFCQFNALSYINNRVVVLNDLCHSCGGCKIICPQQAISEVERSIGKIVIGNSGDTKVVTGILNIGEISGVPIIKEMLKYDNAFSFIDCPPGSNCNVIECVDDADYCILVTEPTLFGISNLEMVYNLTKLFNKPSSVIINKSVGNDDIAINFCKSHNLRLLGSIPFSKHIGDVSIVSRDGQYQKLFLKILNNLKDDINERIINS